MTAPVSSPISDPVSDWAPESPSIRQQRLQNTGKAILASALDHFSRRGFEGASLREIAADAGVQHGMIRHIYQTKEELWRRTIAFLFDRMEREMPAELTDGEPRGLDGFKAFVRWYVGYCARHPEHARLMVQQSILEGPGLAWTAEHYIGAGYRWYRPIIERLQRQGSLPDVDPLTFSLMLTAACQMPYLLSPEIRAVAGRDVHADAEIEAHAEAVIRVFLRQAG